MERPSRARACVRCRLRKTKCEVPGEENVCKGCEASGEICTYDTAPHPKKETLDAIQDRLVRLQKYLEKTLPGSDFTAEMNSVSRKALWLTSYPGESYAGSPSSRASVVRSSPNDLDLQSMPAPAHDSELDKSAEATSILEFPKLNESQRFLRSLFPENALKIFLEVHPDDDDVEYMTQFFKNMEVWSPASSATSSRYFGRSSGVSFLQLVLALRDQTGMSPMTWASVRFDSFRLQQRPAANPIPSYAFGDLDLVLVLVNLYFRCANLNIPLLHRPTFERGIICGLHLSNDRFAKTLVLVCAIGARYSRDPRTLEDAATPWTRGEKWYRQVADKAPSVEETPSIYDLQYYCLHALFNIGSFHPEGCWITTGIGLRMAQDVAAHRRQSSKPTIEGELWKRAFWVLTILDRELSSAYGRIPIMTTQDFDADLPLEVDDEFWESSDDSTPAFVQTAGKISAIAFFNAMIRLSEILATTLRLFYSVKRRPLSCKDIDTVAELDSKLNQWLESLTPALRWNPENQDPVYRQLAIRIHTHYYLLEMLLHRPFIPSPRAGKYHKFANFPALALCSNAARRCIRMILPGPAIDFEDTCMSVGIIEMTALFNSSLVLLCGLWKRKHIDTSFDMHDDPDMRMVHNAMDLLKSCDHIWHDAGLLRDMLNEMVYPKDTPIPKCNDSLSEVPDFTAQLAEQDDLMAIAAVGHGDAGMAPWDSWIPAEDIDYPMLQETYAGYFPGGENGTAYGL